jgi:hypothetical protein
MALIPCAFPKLARALAQVSRVNTFRPHAESTACGAMPPPPPPVMELLLAPPPPSPLSPVGARLQNAWSQTVGAADGGAIVVVHTQLWLENRRAWGGWGLRMVAVASASKALLQLGSLALGPLGVGLVAVLLALLLTGALCIVWRTRVRTLRSVADIMNDSEVKTACPPNRLFLSGDLAASPPPNSLRLN